jgi:hypothetical protein
VTGQTYQYGIRVSEDAWLHLALIAEAYERGGWPAPGGRLRPLETLRGDLLLPLVDGTWRRDSSAPDPVRRARELGARVARETTARAGFADLVTVRRDNDVRFGEIVVAASPYPRRIVVRGPNLPTVEIARHGPGEDFDPADPIGTREERALTLHINGRRGVLLTSDQGSGREAYDVVAVAWGRRYTLHQLAPDRAEILRAEERVARLLTGDPEPARRYAVGWDLTANAIDRAMTHALAAAFRVGATTWRERLRTRRIAYRDEHRAIQKAANRVPAPPPVAPGLAGRWSANPNR